MIIRIPLFFTIFSVLAAAQDFQKTCYDIKWESKDKHDPSISASCGGPNGDKHNVLRLNDCYAYNGGGKFDIVEGYVFVSFSHGHSTYLLSGIVETLLKRVH